MSITPLRFSGISTYSDDFQAIVDRAVAIANLPVKAVQQDQLRVLSEKAAIGGLNSAVAKLATDLKALGQRSESGSVSASSGSSKLSVTARAGALPGNWRVDSIDSIAEKAIATSSAGYDSATSSAVAGAGRFLRLQVGAGVHEIQLGAGADNLTAVRDKINSLGAGVTASILYSGGATPKHYLTLTATETGAQQISLESRDMAAPLDPGTELVTVTKAGTDAVLWINGVKVQRSTNTIDDALTGLTLNATQKTSAGESITIAAAVDRGGIKDALAKFADSYNALVANLDEHMGQRAGVLGGNAILRQIRGQLSALGAFSRDGAVGSLSDLGLVFDKTGVLSLDSSRIESMSAGQVGELLSFLNPDDGLASRVGALTAFSDLSQGLIQKQIDEYDSSGKRMAAQIEEMTARIGAMQESLLARLQKADALLATLDSQRSMLDASVQSLNMVLYGKKNS